LLFDFLALVLEQALTLSGLDDGLAVKTQKPGSCSTEHTGGAGYSGNMCDTPWNCPISAPYFLADEEKEIFTMKVHQVLYAIVAVVLLVGCGGGSSDAPQTTPVRVAVNWAARSRNLDAPSSAQSAVITLKEANLNGTDFNFTINRRTNPTEYTASYTSPQSARVGNWPLQVRFFAEAGGGGGIVGSAQDTITLRADGTGIETITTVNLVAAVEIPTGQEVEVNYRKDLLFTAKDAQGRLVAASPGSAFWQIVNSQGALVMVGGQAEGIRAGRATVAVTVDGKTSPTVPVNVVYRISDYAGTWSGTWRNPAYFIPGSTHQGTLSVTISASGAVTGTLHSQNNLTVGGLTTNGQDATIAGTLSKAGDITFTATYPNMSSETIYTCTGTVPLEALTTFPVQYAGGANNTSGTLLVDLARPGSTSIAVQ
jgi:hypothetical protein